MGLEQIKLDLSTLNGRHRFKLFVSFFTLAIFWPEIFELFTKSGNKGEPYLITFDAAFLVIWTIFWSLSAYFLIPKNDHLLTLKDQKTRLSDRKIWTSWYDFFWICVAVCGLASQAWKIADHSFQSSMRSQERLSELNQASLIRTAKDWIPKLEITKQTYIGDSVLHTEFTAIASDRWVELIENSFSYGTKRNLNYLSDDGRKALHEIQSAINNKNAANERIWSLWSYKKKRGEPEGFAIFYMIVICLALGLRLAKAIADTTDSKWARNLE